MNETPVTAHLAVTVSGSQVFADLTFHNTSAQPVYLDKLMAGLAGPVQSKLFEVTKNGEPVDYIGPMAKRAAPGPGDYFRLNAEDSVRTRAVLTELYDIRPGDHVYRVRYSAFHGYPDKPGIWDLESKETSFRLER